MKIDSHSNLLDAVRMGTPYEIEDATKIASEIVNPDGRDIGYKENTTIGLLAAVILYVLYAMPDKTLHGVAEFLGRADRGEDIFLIMAKSDVHPLVTADARIFSEKFHPTVKDCITANALRCMSPYRDQPSHNG